MKQSPMNSLWLLSKPSSSWTKKLDPVRPKTLAGRINGAFLMGMGLLLFCLFNLPFYGAHRAHQALEGLDEKAASSWLLGGTLEVLAKWKEQAEDFDQKVWLKDVEDSALSQLAAVKPGLSSIKPTPHSISLVWVEAPLQFRAVVEARLREEGFVVSEEKCASCIDLVWRGQGWAYRMKDAVVQKREAFLGLQRALKRTEKTVASTMAVSYTHL